MDFPFLAKKPDVSGYKEARVADPTIRSTFENGAIATRKKFTKTPKTWEFKYSSVSNDDKEILEAFERDIVAYGGLSFNWIDPIVDVSHEVKFANLIKYSLENTQFMTWTLTIKVMEA